MAESAKPKRLPREELWAQRKEEILTQAALLFAEHGYSETDTQLLAETLGVGKGTVYRYFPSKRELFLAAADRVMRMLRERVDARVADACDPLQKVQDAIHEFLSFFNEHPQFVELLIQERAQFKDRTRPTFMEHRAVNIERWKTIYRGLIADGRVRELSVDQITEVIGNLLYGTIFTNYFNGQTSDVASQTAGIVGIVFQGILTDPKQASRAERDRPAGACDRD